MIITKKRINNLDKYLSRDSEGKSISIGVSSKHHISKVSNLGLLEEISTLSKLNLGSAARYNLYGKSVPDKSLPKEKFEIEWPYAVKDYGGNRHHGINYIEKERWQRNFVSPYEIGLSLVNDVDNEIILSDSIKNIVSNKDKIKNTINMYLEYFGECYVIVDGKLEINEKRIPWKILPPGENPREAIRNHIRKYHENSHRKYRLDESRMEYLKQFSPDEIMLGSNGYDDYYILSFNKKGIYVAESVKYGNATYIFDHDREKVSKLTKAEVINGGLALDRITHNSLRNKNIKKALT